MTALNGRLDGALLAQIPGTSRRCRVDVMPQVAALRAAFFAHFGRPLVVTDAYRPYDEQVWLKAQKGVFAATPGTSIHGWGLAFDFGSGVNLSINSPEHRWMVEHAPSFGLFHPVWARDFNPKNGQHEPWHWETTGAVPVSRYAHLIPRDVTIPTPVGTVPAPLEPEDDEMSAAGEAAILASLGNLTDRVAELVNAIIPGPGVAATTVQARDASKAALHRTDEVLAVVQNIERQAAGITNALVTEPDGIAPRIVDIQNRI